MKAAVLHAANQPLQIEDVPTPTLTKGHTLLRVLACGAGVLHCLCQGNKVLVAENADQEFDCFAAI